MLDGGGSGEWGLTDAAGAEHPEAISTAAEAANIAPLQPMVGLVSRPASA